MTSDADRKPLCVNSAEPMSEAQTEVPAARPARHPLGPRVRIVSLGHPWRSRLCAAALAAAAAGVLLVAVGLVPRARSLGTHQQLGLPPCGFVTITGLPCPTCGMTTAFAHTVRGQFGQALRAQPFGFLLAVATIGSGLVALTAAVTGRRAAGR